MRIGIFFPTMEQGPLGQLIERVDAIRRQGFSHAWLPQSIGMDAITALSVIGATVPDIELGTAVVPTFPRHPMALAMQALTASAATAGRFRLGIGLSHKRSVEGTYGLSYERPARHMEEYLSILVPLLRDQRADVVGETLTGRGALTVDAAPPPVYVAALQPRMLRLAGGLADGTITWCTGPITLEQQIVPLVRRAAEDASRPSPRVIVALPTILTTDEADGRAKADAQLAGYGKLPVYRAVLDREGVEGPGDVSVVGDEGSIDAQLRRFEEIGATDFIAIPCGTPEDRSRTTAFLASLVR